MILTADYHTHTPYSHGKNTVAENVAQAVKMGLQQVAISDHGFTHLAYGIRRKEIPSFMEECRAAEAEYGIPVLRGIEANVGGVYGDCDLTEKDYENFDVYLCGYHLTTVYKRFGDFFFNGMGNILRNGLKLPYTKTLYKRNTQAYIATIKNHPIDILTHLSFQCPCDTLEVAKCAADHGTYIELNSKKRHLTDEQLMEIVDKTSARFVVDSDAHSASRVGDTALVEEQLERLHFPMDRIDNIDGRFPTFRFTEFKKRM
jgi:putative hydrolase